MSEFKDMDIDLLCAVRNYRETLESEDGWVWKVTGDPEQVGMNSIYQMFTDTEGREFKIRGPFGMHNLSPIAEAKKWRRQPEKWSERRTEQLRKERLQQMGSAIEHAESLTTKKGCVYVRCSMCGGRIVHESDLGNTVRRLRWEE